jgi:hypothetical protein
VAPLGDEGVDHFEEEEPFVMGCSSVDGLYRIIESLKHQPTLENQVYLVESKVDREQYVVKIYMANEQGGYHKEY